MKILGKPVTPNLSQLCSLKNVLMVFLVNNFKFAQNVSNKTNIIT